MWSTASYANCDVKCLCISKRSTILDPTTKEDSCEDGPMARQRHRKLTHVALAAGVSEATASRALNGQPNVSSATREKVLEAAQRLNYRPEPTGRTLREGSVPLVGLIITPQIHEQRRPFPPLFYHRFLATFVDELSVLGHAMVAISHEQGQAGLSTFPLSALAIVFDDFATPIPEGVGFGVPILAMGAHAPDERIRATAQHNVDAMVSDCLTHLSERGATRIALIQRRVPGIQRHAMADVYLRWCEAHHQDPWVIDQEDQTVEASVRTAISGGIDGILDFSANPQSTLAAVSSTGARVPKDVLLVSQGEGVVEDLLVPPLTNISFLGIEAGRQCAKAVSELVATGQTESFAFPYEITARASTTR